MTKKTKYILWGAAGLLLLIMSRAAWYTITDWLIPQFEGFLPHPKWDYQQYTWGYGTRAPGPDGTITKEQALQEMRKYLQNDYAYLEPQLSRKLNAHQWAALLSFSYNLGRGNAQKLIPYINAGNDAVLFSHWEDYINAGGSPDPVLIARRDLEIKIWQGTV